MKIYEVIERDIPVPEIGWVVRRADPAHASSVLAVFFWEVDARKFAKEYPGIVTVTAIRVRP